MNHDLINLQRLTARLEERLLQEAFTDYNDFTKFHSNYQYAVQLALKVQSNPAKPSSSSNSTSNNSIESINKRLDELKTKLQASKENIRPREVSKKRRRSSVLKPDVPSESVTEEQKVLKLDPLPTLDSNVPDTSFRRRLNLDSLPSLETPSDSAIKRKPSHSRNEDPSTLLQHHRDLQESLTSDLTSMATQLKLNSLHFQTNLQKDKALMENVEESMDGNLNTMVGQNKKLGAVRKKSGWTTCYVVMAVAAVAVAWFFMFAVIKIT